MLPFKLDLSNISGTGIAQVLFPFVPGGVLTVGAMIIRQDVTERFFSVAYIGYYTKIALVLLSAYVAGLFLATAVIGIIGGIAGFLGGLLGEHFRRKFDLKPSEKMHWRHLATRFVDDGLTPSQLELPRQDALYKVEFDAATRKDEQIGPMEMDERMKMVSDNTARILAGFEWKDWYRVLDAFFSRPETPTSVTVATYVSQAAYCSAAAVLILLHFSEITHPIIYAVCYAVLAGAFLEYLFTVVNPRIVQDDGARQCAAILAVLRAERLARDASQRVAEK